MVPASVSKPIAAKTGLTSNQLIGGAICTIECKLTTLVSEKAGALATKLKNAVIKLSFLISRLPRRDQNLIVIMILRE